MENTFGKWYTLRTKSRHEFIVRNYMQRKGFEVFLPTYSKLRQWSDRRKHIEFPLFSGYCFVRFSHRDRMHVMRGPGVAGIVGLRGRGISIPEEEIRAIRKVTESGLAYDPFPYLQEGMRVQVINGPLSGIQGVLFSKHANHRLIIGINLLKQGASVEIYAEDVLPIEFHQPKPVFLAS